MNFFSCYLLGKRVFLTCLNSLEMLSLCLVEVTKSIITDNGFEKFKNF